MSFTRRQVTRIDGPQAEIVQALRKVGCRVELVGRPVDLLVHHARWGDHWWRLLEVKETTGKRAPKPRLDKRQKAQAAFLAETGTPVVTSPIEALRALHLIEFNLEVS